MNAALGDGAALFRELRPRHLGAGVHRQRDGLFQRHPVPHLGREVLSVSGWGEKADRQSGGGEAEAHGGAGGRGW
ncbi:MAG TPA: hypothetical protein EYQ24_15445 [Bacteroidetes bacterium]|nr:hypothetical protein [Bacteroidota bacterium]